MDISQAEATTSSSSSCSSNYCFGFPCFGQTSRKGRDADHLLEENPNQADSWWLGKANKVREWSEVVVGPKWKNFIRKIGSWTNSQKRRRCNKGRFQYDSLDYALNFDQHQGDPDHLPYTFSARFTAPRAATTPQDLLT